MISVTGPEAQSVIEANFTPICDTPYSQTAPRKIVYGIWTPTGEDLIVYRSCTDNFEIHCHGGTAASTAILKHLNSDRVQELTPLEFKTISQGLWKSEIFEALSKATTHRTAKILLNQLKLLPENINTILDDVESGHSQAAISKLERICGWSDYGIHLTQPRSVVLCGRPNVGKSSLINAMVGYQRAIVHDAPGTTRDVVSQQTAFDGWPVELTDTAGLRTSANEIEAIGIQKAKAEIESADLKICVFDVAEPWSAEDEATCALVAPDILIHNKCDIISNSGTKGHNISTQSRPEGILTSAETGVGIDQLIERIGQTLIPKTPPPDQAIPISPKQTARLREVISQLSTAPPNGAEERNSIATWLRSGGNEPQE